MQVNVFCHAYWRSIKNGNRTYEAIPDIYKEGVKYLAQTDVANNVITKEEYEALIGENYVENNENNEA